MSQKCNPFNTDRIRPCRRKMAKELRDKLINAITTWDKDTRAISKCSSLKPEQFEFAISQVIKDAYAGLVWKSLDPEELYNTPYHKKVIENLRKDHPDLSVSKSIRYIASWHFFNQKDIEVALSNNIKPLFPTDKDMKSAYDKR